MWLLLAPRAAKVLMVLRASGSSRFILACSPRNSAGAGAYEFPSGEARPAPDKTDRFIRGARLRRCAVDARMSDSGH